MKQKQETNKFVIIAIFLSLVLLLTFISKSVYNYRLPVVLVTSPIQGRMSFKVEKTATIAYPYIDSIYSELDGRVKEILVQVGDEVHKGQSIMKFKRYGTDEIIDITAEDDGIITNLGVKKGMYVSSMQNTVLYKLAKKTNEWAVAVIITDDEYEYVDMDSTAIIEIINLKERMIGEIQSIIPYADQSTSGYLIEILIHSENKDILGRKAKITLTKDSPQYDTLIPTEALRKDRLGYYILALKEDDSVIGNGYVAGRMSVELLDSDTKYCAVRGLTADEKVITSSTKEIEDGTKVYYEGEDTE